MKHQWRGFQPPEGKVSSVGLVWKSLLPKANHLAIQRNSSAVWTAPGWLKSDLRSPAEQARPEPLPRAPCQPSANPSASCATSATTQAVAFAACGSDRSSGSISVRDRGTRTAPRKREERGGGRGAAAVPTSASVRRCRQRARPVSRGGFQRPACLGSWRPTTRLPVPPAAALAPGRRGCRCLSRS